VEHGAAAAARQVTSAQQHQQLRQLGCSVARGPHYGEAMSAADARELLSSD
jgi:EAL domain-containing protein (putative c-di-GMP-specific phosphodiesterase class I)